MSQFHRETHISCSWQPFRRHNLQEHPEQANSLWNVSEIEQQIDVYIFIVASFNSQNGFWRPNSIRFFCSMDTLHRPKALLGSWPLSNLLNSCPPWRYFSGWGCVWIHVCIYVYIYTYIYQYVCAYIYVCVCIYTYVSKSNMCLTPSTLIFLMSLAKRSRSFLFRSLWRCWAKITTRWAVAAVLSVVGVVFDRTWASLARCKSRPRAIVNEINSWTPAAHQKQHEISTWHHQIEEWLT